MFDPFDPQHANVRQRRKHSEVVFDRKQWIERVDNHFRRAMEDLGWPEYVRGPDIWDHAESCADSNLPRQTLVRNARKSMERLGYEKMPNPASGDGRWNFEWGTAVIYRRSGSKSLDRWEVKDVLGV